LLNNVTNLIKILRKIKHHTNQYRSLKPKQHFEILDGLRGIAALAIVVFHFIEIVYPPAENFIAHGFLAVDFFFCLYGFVIAYAYHDRMEKMSLIYCCKQHINGNVIWKIAKNV